VAIVAALLALGPLRPVMAAAGSGEAVRAPAPFACGRPVRLVPEKPHLGDLVAIYVEAPTRGSGTATPSLSLFGYRAELAQVGPRCLRALVPVPIDATPKAYVLTVDRSDRVLKMWVEIEQREWDHSELKVSSQFTDKPNKQLEERLKKEEREWQAMWHASATRPHFAGRFFRPVPGQVTAPFGTQRIFNGKKQSVHLGLDLEAQIGDPIRAMQAGRVVLSSARFVSGGTIVIDHGNGLFSAYFHQVKRKKEVGAWVESGELIGWAGKTGRVTGPHLHLSIMVRVERALGGAEGEPDKESKTPDKDEAVVRTPVGIYVNPEQVLEMAIEGERSFVDRPPTPPKKVAARPPPSAAEQPKNR
jgi:murein DD-endopeptidase MepM/ murein hydrolase activator NlpD